MTKKMGRPPKASSDEKIALVNQYYISQSGEDASAIGHHGIYRKLSDFAKTIGFNLEPHDFSRDKVVVAHIIALSSTTSESTTSSQAIPTYEPLDITVLMVNSKNTIAAILKDRERYFESLHKKAARAIENNILLSEKHHYLQKELNTVKEQLSSAEQANKNLKNQLHSLQKDVSYLRRVFRRDVEPERAQQFLQSLNSQDAAVDIARDSVMCNIHTLGNSDQILQAEAEKEADMLCLKSLFTK